MPITQTMTFTATPPTTGETPTTFNYNAIACWNELKLNVVPDLNTAFTEMNALETNVNAKEASAVASAEAAVSAANFKGNWSNATSYTIGDSVLYLGITYKAILSGSNQNPSTATTYWSPLSIASSIKYTPSGEVSATTVQGAIDELSAEKLSVVNIHAATDKTTPVDADELPLMDSATSFSLKKLTWTNIKATLKTYFDTIYANLFSPALTGTPTAPTAPIGTNTTQIATTANVIDSEKTKGVFLASYTLADGTAGGNTTASGQTYPFNTTDKNTITGASMTASVITLPAGKYLVYANIHTESALDTSGGILSLNDGSADILWGTKYDAGSVYGLFANLTLQSYLDIASTKTISLKGWWTAQTNGLGTASTSFTGFEKYGEIMFIKVG